VHHLLFDCRYRTVIAAVRIEEWHCQPASPSASRRPSHPEVRITGNGNYDFAWLDKLARRSEVGFSIPLTRSLNTQADLVRDGQHFVPGAEVIPTAKGDPLLQDVRAPVKDSDTVLSASAARRLGVQPGDILRLMVSRKSEGKTNAPRSL
jgi:putative ABC transport system permease protein